MRFDPTLLQRALRIGAAYKTLGLAYDASFEAIKTARKKKQLDCHPDKGGVTEKSQEINSAFDLLNEHKDNLKQYTDILREYERSGKYNTAADTCLTFSSFKAACENADYHEKKRLYESITIRVFENWSTSLNSSEEKFSLIDLIDLIHRSPDDANTANIIRCFVELQREINRALPVWLDAICHLLSRLDANNARIILDDLRANQFKNLFDSRFNSVQQIENIERLCALSKKAYADSKVFNQFITDLMDAFSSRVRSYHFNSKDDLFILFSLTNDLEKNYDEIFLRPEFLKETIALSGGWKEFFELCNVKNKSILEKFLSRLSNHQYLAALSLSIIELGFLLSCRLLEQQYSEIFSFIKENLKKLILTIEHIKSLLLNFPSRTHQQILNFVISSGLAQRIILNDSKNVPVLNLVTFLDLIGNLNVDVDPILTKEFLKSLTPGGNYNVFIDVILKSKSYIKLLTRLIDLDLLGKLSCFTDVVRLLHSVNFALHSKIINSNKSIILECEVRSIDQAAYVFSLVDQFPDEFIEKPYCPILSKLSFRFITANFMQSISAYHKLLGMLSEKQCDLFFEYITLLFHKITSFSNFYELLNCPKLADNILKKFLEKFGKKFALVNSMDDVNQLYSLEKLVPYHEKITEILIDCGFFKKRSINELTIFLKMMVITDDLRTKIFNIVMEQNKIVVTSSIEALSAFFYFVIHSNSVNLKQAVTTVILDQIFKMNSQECSIEFHLYLLNILESLLILNTPTDQAGNYILWFNIDDVAMKLHRILNGLFQSIAKKNVMKSSDADNFKECIKKLKSITSFLLKYATVGCLGEEEIQSAHKILNAQNDKNDKSFHFFDRGVRGQHLINQVNTSEEKKGSCAIQ